MEKLVRNPKIATKVVEYVRNGVSMKDIIGSIQTFPDAPLSLQSLYKYYGDDISEARAEVVSSIGGKVVQQALDGDQKSQELYLRSKGGWSPNNTTTVEDNAGDPDMDEGIVDDLMVLLGKS